MDIIQQLGPLAMASRLRRISDRLMRGAFSVYQEQRLRFEPRWFPVFYLLSRQSQMAVTEIARELRVSHPAVNQVAGALERAGLIVSRNDKMDSRKRLLSLSTSGKQLVRRLAPIWRDIEQAARELLDESGADLLSALDQIEHALDDREMFSRIKAKIKERQLEAVEILDYKPQYRRYFEMFNRQWIEKYFVVEPPDEKILRNPKCEILKRGGQILFARVDGKILGTTALIYRDKTTFELAKMAVTEKAQGQQIGKRLALAALERARSLGARSVILNTNPKLLAANKLYRQLGFVQIAATPQPNLGYQRPSITLKLSLEVDKKPNKPSN